MPKDPKLKLEKPEDDGKRKDPVNLQVIPEYDLDDPEVVEHIKKVVKEKFEDDPLMFYFLVRSFDLQKMILELHIKLEMIGLKIGIQFPPELAKLKVQEQKIARPGGMQMKGQFPSDPLGRPLGTG